MDFASIIELLDKYGIPLVAIGLLTAAVAWLLKRLLSAMDERVKRAEELHDLFKPSIDALTSATNEHTAAIRALDKNVERLVTVVNALLAQGGRPT